MKDLGDTIKQVYTEERFMFILIIVNLILSVALFVISIINLNPAAAVVKIGYGDIGGYRSGSWADMLAFPILSIVFGIFHAMIALRVFKKRGSGMTKFFLITTTALILGTGIILLRLLEKV